MYGRVKVLGETGGTMKVGKEKLKDSYLIGYALERELQTNTSLLAKRRGRSYPNKDDIVEKEVRELFWEKGEVIVRRNSFLWEIYSKEEHQDGIEFVYKADLKFLNLVTDVKEDGSSYGGSTVTSKKVSVTKDMCLKAKEPGKAYICLALDLLVGGVNELFIVVKDLHDALQDKDLFADAESGLYFNIKNYLRGIGRV